MVPIPRRAWVRVLVGASVGSGLLVLWAVTDRLVDHLHWREWGIFS